MTKRQVRKQRDFLPQEFFEKPTKNDWQPTFDLPPGEPEEEELATASVQERKCQSCLLNPEIIESFKSKNFEIRLRTLDMNVFYLVPEYTTKERLEVSVEHLALLTAMVHSTAGVGVVSIKRITTEDAEGAEVE